MPPHKEGTYNLLASCTVVACQCSCTLVCCAAARSVSCAMVLVRFTTVVPLARAAAFAYAGDFANIAKWDPGVKSSVKVRGAQR